MRIFALQLNNEIKGVAKRKAYIASLIASLQEPDLVVLPELAICSYMATQEIWHYADNCGEDTSEWAMRIAQKYNTKIAVGYLDKEDGEYYNRYLIAGNDSCYGTVTKSEGESAVFKRGKFGSVIRTPFGNVAVAICYDARRKNFYDNIKDENISMILFPHGSPADPKKAENEIRTNDYFCGAYEKAFNVPVVYVNSVGALEEMSGRMGNMMKKASFKMNGRTKIYCSRGHEYHSSIPEAYGIDVDIYEQSRKVAIPFYGDDVIKGNWLFRKFILEPDTKQGIVKYDANK